MAQQSWAEADLETRRSLAARYAETMQRGVAPSAKTSIEDVAREAEKVLPVARQQVVERTQEIRAAIVAGKSTPEMSLELRGLAVESDRIGRTRDQLATLKESGVKEIALPVSQSSGRERLAEIGIAAAATNTARLVGPASDAERSAIIKDGAAQARFESPQRFIENQAKELGQRFGKDAAWLSDAGRQAQTSLLASARSAGLEIDSTKLPAGAFSNAALKSYADNPKSLESVISNALTTGRQMPLTEAASKASTLSDQASRELLRQGVIAEDRLKTGMGTPRDRSELATIQIEMLQTSGLKHQIASLQAKGLASVTVHLRDNESPRDTIHAIQQAVSKADLNLTQRQAQNMAAMAGEKAAPKDAVSKTPADYWKATAAAGAATKAARAATLTEPPPARRAALS